MDPNKKKLLVYLGAFLVICLIFFGGFYIGKINLNQTTQSNSSSQYVLTGDLKSQYQGVSVNILWQTWDELENEYINTDNLDPQAMVYGAVKGLVGSLNDPYTNFLTPDETVQYAKTNAGEYEGIGATLRQDGDYVQVESPVEKSPAQLAGIKANDVILEVDHQSVEKQTVYDVAAKIRGTAGTSVHLQIYRDSTKQTLEFDIVRAAITIDNISYEKLANNIVKIDILRFTDTDVNSFDALWDKVVSEVIATNPKGIIVDLRNNPGGYVSGVEYVLNDFIAKGNVIFMEQGKDGSKVEHTVTRDGRLLNYPIVVMVNQGTASAAEIFTGAIQDYAKGKVVGMPTVGKGVEQKIINMPDGSMLEVVFQKWLTPKGTNITKQKPIQPDFQIDDPDQQQAKAVELLTK